MWLSRREMQQIGIFLLLPAFVAVSIVLPAAGPPVVLVDIFILAVILEFVSAVSATPEHFAASGHLLGIRPRSPPAF